MSTVQVPAPELTRRERGFICRIMAKYPDGQPTGEPLYRSLAVFVAMLLAAHVIEQVVPTWWLPLLLITPPAVWLFSRYRRFSIFRSCVLSKVAGRLSQYEVIVPARPEASAGNAPHAACVPCHPHGVRRAATATSPSGA